MDRPSSRRTTRNQDGQQSQTLAHKAHIRKDPPTGVGGSLRAESVSSPVVWWRKTNPIQIAGHMGRLTLHIKEGTATADALLR